MQRSISSVSFVSFESSESSLKGPGRGTSMRVHSFHAGGVRERSVLAGFEILRRLLGEIQKYSLSDEVIDCFFRKSTFSQEPDRPAQPLECRSGRGGTSMSHGKPPIGDWHLG